MFEPELDFLLGLCSEKFNYIVKETLQVELAQLAGLMLCDLLSHFFLESVQSFVMHRNLRCCSLFSYLDSVVDESLHELYRQKFWLPESPSVGDISAPSLSINWAEAVS